jgi:hypothetical protein
MLYPAGAQAAYNAHIMASSHLIELEIAVPAGNEIGSRLSGHGLKMTLVSRKYNAGLRFMGTKAGCHKALIPLISRLYPQVKAHFGRWENAIIWLPEVVPGLPRQLAYRIKNVIQEA